jgi:hypothetical protein
LQDLAAEPPLAPGRVRRPGGGRKTLVDSDPRLLADLLKLVEPSERGDPMSPLRWTCKSLRRLVAELARLGHRVSHTVVGEMLKAQKFSARSLLRRDLVLMTRVRRNMKRLPVSFLDKALLNGRNIVETIIGHSKEFSSLRLPKHRSVFNAFTHLTAALVAYQINPLPPKPIGAFIS